MVAFLMDPAIQPHAGAAPACSNADPSDRDISNNRAWIVVAALVFLAYAITFLCFFVDDEAITFQYAQNVLRGRGLSYSLAEGATEGYSNFLHVGVATGVLALVRALGWPKIAVFVVGKAISLASGLALIAVTGRALTALVPDRRAHIAPLFLLALSGPVALWSCSSLETIPFVLLFTGFVVSLLGNSPSAAIGAAVLGAATILMRVDGFVYAAAAGIAAYVFAVPAQRRILLRMVAPSLAAVFTAYQAWRYWYFGSLLSLPLQTKVLYKLFPNDALVRNIPPVSYLSRFLHIYHPAALAALACGWLLFWRRGDDRRPFALLAIAAAVVGYAAVIGDWMMGFRFFATVFPLLTLLAAYSVAAVSRRQPRLAMIGALSMVVWSASTAHAFVRVYESDGIGWRSWWTRPTLDPHLFFAPYYGFYEDVRGIMPPGTVTVNNQAGFLPFMLDLENIDDLAICSRFLAGLPTADVTFTETGRYYPLTERPPLIAGEAYIVHRRPQFLIALRHLLRSANSGHVPRVLLGGAFNIVHTGDFQVLYHWTGLSPTADSPDEYRENLAHPAYLRMAAVQGSVVPPQNIRAQLPFLVGDRAHYPLVPSALFEVHLTGDPVTALWLDQLVATAPADVNLTLYDRSGGIAIQEQRRLAANEPFHYNRQLEHPVAGGVLTLDVIAASTGASVEIADLRVLGQRPALRKHVAHELFEPAAH